MRFKYRNSEFILNKGDCLYIDSSAAHTGEQVGDEPQKILIVLHTGSSKGPMNFEQIKRRIVKQH